LRTGRKHARKLRETAGRLGAASYTQISWDSEDHGAIPAWKWMLASCGDRTTSADGGVEARPS
ncbi:MAG: hypothetical protein ACP5KY_07915, partial [Thermoproteus sp.]